MAVEGAHTPKGRYWPKSSSTTAHTVTLKPAAERAVGAPSTRSETLLEGGVKSREGLALSRERKSVKGADGPTAGRVACQSARGGLLVGAFSAAITLGRW